MEGRSEGRRRAGRAVPDRARGGHDLRLDAEGQDCRSAPGGDPGWRSLVEKELRRQRLTSIRLDPEHRVAAEWGESAGASFPVDIEIEATARTGLLRDISDVLARERLNVTASRGVSRDAAARMNFTVGVVDLGQLERVLALLRNVRGVMHAARRRQPTVAKEAPKK
jgi:uncharacterized protein (AIM24 family)